MPRTVRDATLDTRAARMRLKARGKPYWRAIEQGLHLGYRRLSNAPGRWCARRYVGKQSYKVETLGTADDYSEADGETVLSFAQAQRKAQTLKPKAGPLTVRQAVETYLEHLEARTGTYDAGLRAQAFILPKLGDVEVEALTTARLREWHNGLAKLPPRLRTAKGKPQQYGERDDSDEGRRRRRSSANRVLAVLKGALNHAWREGRVPSDVEWRRVKPFPGTVAARVRYLTVAEAQRLINASEGEFRPLVQAALATGCRYSELARLTVSDFNPDAGTLHILKSKSGKPRHVILTDEGAALFRQWSVGRNGNDLFFRAPRGGPWLASCQERPMKLACKRARIEPRVSFHILRHTWASLSTMSGMPLMIVARNLGHVDTRMVEKHYGHLSPSYVTEAIRAHAPRFGAEPSNVTALR